jgi:hypothetical protein
MKIIIIENLYPKFGIVNESIGYFENMSFIDLEWIQKYIQCIPP